MGCLTLVTGGARSGKSTLAESLACAQTFPVIYLATGVAYDQEMADRIKLHQDRRPTAWMTIEEPTQLADRLLPCPDSLVLLDCLSLWVSNQFLAADPDDKESLDRCQVEILERCDELITLFVDRPGPAIVVTNEVGLGLVPPYPLGRVYRDTLGWVNQRMAKAADQVHICFSGIPVRIK